VRYLEDPDLVLLQGDVRAELATLPEGCVDCVVTSPPYWGLRDYGTGDWEGGDPACDHLRFRVRGDFEPRRSTLAGSKHSTKTIAEQERAAAAYRDECGKCGARRRDSQLGLEPTPELYVAALVDVFREVRRVLSDRGTVWLNLGDSYCARFESPGLKPKDLVGIPWRGAFALQADGWYLRSDVVWSKPNPMPESVTDRPTKSHEYVFLLTKSARYYFDQEAVREPFADDRLGNPGGGGNYMRELYPDRPAQSGLKRGEWNEDGTHAGRNIRSVWEITTQGYAEAHFATFPIELVRRCVVAGTSERGVCPLCRAPWVRKLLEAPNIHPGDSGSAEVQGRIQRGYRADGKAIGTQMRERHEANSRVPTTIGWRRSCTHDALPEPSVVLDPFMGSGTTALVARWHGRRSIGVELKPEYCELVARRLAQQSLIADEAAQVSGELAEQLALEVE